MRTGALVDSVAAMKSRILGGLLFLVAVSGAGAAEGWLKSLPAEQFAAAGLTKLTPTELAALEQLVANRAAQVAAVAPAAPPLPATAAKSPPSWFRALITLQETQEKPEAAEAIESRLAGDYSGWSGRTVFRLANGQIW